jgi:hypothetical protein
VEAEPPEEMTLVGGCNGVHVVPGRYVHDYYRAHAYVAGGASVLLALTSLGVLVL